MGEVKASFLKRVVLRNYKSIKHCDVSLGPLTILVGPNGSGKSNFLDAIQFVAESLRTTPDQALRERGGIAEVRRRSRGHPNHFAIDLWLSLPEEKSAYFTFQVAAKPNRAFEIEEKCSIQHDGRTIAAYRVVSGKVEHASFQPRPPASMDRLYLTIASAFPEFRGLYDMLSGMGFYNINPEQLRDLQEPGPANLLLRDGRNAASVVSGLDDYVRERIEEYLGNIARGVKHVAKKPLGHKETLEFKQSVAGDENPWSFLAQNMSDGTLRALGVLVALFQCFDRPAKTPIPLVGIEEPESTLHPAAAGVLLDALREASHYTQVLVTTHSPELLDAKEIDADSLLVVEADGGESIIERADEASRSIMHDRLSTAGELLKLDQLRPQPRPNQSQPVTANSERFPLFPDEQ